MSGHDQERVIELRRKGFERLGLDPQRAAELAGDLSLDYASVLAHVHAGFPPEIAVDLARSGQRPVF